MAIYHLSAQIISRGRGQSALVAAAYRHGCEMEFEREGRTVSYISKHEAIHSEMLLPQNTPQWLRDGIDGRDAHGAAEFFFNAVEEVKRKDAQLVRELEFALPRELSREQNIELTREFLSEFTDLGMVVDFSYHDKPGNPHIHALCSIKPLIDDPVKKFGSTKVPVLDENGQPKRIKTKGGERIVYEQWAGSRDDLLDWRRKWKEYADRALERAGHDIRIDHRSHAERGLDLEPNIHIGLDAAAMQKRGAETERAEKHEAIRARNLERLRENPDRILQQITEHQSVFTRDDISREIFRHVDDETEFSQLLAKVETSSELVPLRAPSQDAAGRRVDKAHWTTREMLQVETDMVNCAVRMDHRRGFGVKASQVDAALERYDFLSEEQRAAVRHVTDKNQISAVVGFAGAGKSTLLKAAREAYEAQGFKVYGATIAGKAAEELQKSSGINSRTIASLEYALSHGRHTMEQGDVYIIDEAGMVGSKTLASLMRQTETAGAKLVLAGDPDQLQPIAAGGAFRAVTDRIGYAEVSEIRRQKEAWQREASLAFARGRIEDGLKAYQARGFHHGNALKTDAIKGMGRAIVSDIEKGRETLGLAHTNADVVRINEAVRHQLKERGKLQDEIPFETSKGERAFAAGDRLVFLQNDKKLGGGVKNGMLGEVRRVKDGTITVRTDCGKNVSFDKSRYDSIDHGFAVTVHKSQGATIQHTHVLATRGFTRNLSYVAMTRHRESLNVHYSKKSFSPGGGMAECLSKRDDKPVSVDFETTKAFGERRGHDTRKALMRAAKTIVRTAHVRARGVYDWLKGLRDSGEADRARETAEQKRREAARKQAEETRREGVKRKRAEQNPSAFKTKRQARADQFKSSRLESD